MILARKEGEAPIMSKKKEVCLCATLVAVISFVTTTIMYVPESTRLVGLPAFVGYWIPAFSTIIIPAGIATGIKRMISKNNIGNFFMRAF